MDGGGAIPRTGRPKARTLVLSALLVAAVACSGPDASGPRKGGTAVAAMPTAASTVLPPLARNSLDGELGDLLFPGLERPRWEPGGLVFPEGPELALAEARRFGPDSTTVTYRIASDRRWSDGRPVTAGDVVFTYRLLARPGSALPLSRVTARLDSVVAHGDTAVTFHFARRYPGMLFDASAGVLPRHLFGPVPAGEEAAHLSAVVDSTLARGRLPGSGPFVLASWERGDRLVLVASPEAPIRPGLDTLAVRIVPEEATRLAELRTGDVHLVRGLSFRRASELRSRPGVRVDAVPKRAYDYLAWNPAGHPAFGEPRVRRALSLALDRERLIEALEMGPWAEPARGPYGPLFPGLAAAQPPARHDTAAARRLLREAGWVREAGGEGPDGVRTKDGRELAFDLLVPAGDAHRSAAAQLIRADLRRLGVDVRVRTMEFNALFGRMRAGDYQAALLGWQVGLDPDISPFWAGPDAPLNVVGYGDPAVSARIDSALASATASEAVRHWRAAGAAIARDHPYAFLWYYDLPVVLSERLQGADPGVLGVLRDAHAWRLSAGD